MGHLSESDPRGSDNGRCFVKATFPIRIKVDRYEFQDGHQNQNSTN